MSEAKNNLAAGGAFASGKFCDSPRMIFLMQKLDLF
jgi:hypothetical protein